MAAPSPAEAKYQLAHASEDTGGQELAAVVAVTILANVAVIARFISRKLVKVPLKWDDWAIVVALLLVWGQFTCNILELQNGLGRHALTVPKKQVLGYLKIRYPAELIYVFALFMEKCSILLFYGRLFINRQRSIFKMFYYAVWAFNITTFFVVLFLFMFQCNPMAKGWDPLLPGKCIAFNPLIFSTAIINILIDVSILILPMPVVWRLQMENKRRLALTAVFMMGGFVCVASIVRLTFLLNVNIADATWSNKDVSTWTTVETCMGIVSACLPIMSPIFRRPRKYIFSGKLSRPSRGSAPLSSKGSMPGVGRSRQSERKSGPQVTWPFDDEQGVRNHVLPTEPKPSHQRSNTEDIPLHGITVKRDMSAEWSSVGRVPPRPDVKAGPVSHIL